MMSTVQFRKRLEAIYNDWQSVDHSEGHIEVDKVKQKSDIVDVVGQRIELKRSGANYKACCPFHEEKTPSFVVTRSKQMFKCFGCGISGDVITFVMIYDNCDFKTAISKIGG
jgi:DNA primase